MPRAIFLKKIKYQSSLNTFKYGRKLVLTCDQASLFFFRGENKGTPDRRLSLCRPLVFNHFCHKYQIFSFEFIKVCLRRFREIRATRNIKSRLAIEFPIPYEWWSNALPPGQEKASNALGMPRWGVLKLRFDWYIKLRSRMSKNIHLCRDF